MKTLIPISIVLIVYVGFIVCVTLSIPHLPNLVASHFDERGQPDQWVSRSSFVMFSLIFESAQIFVLLMISFIFSFICKFLPDSLINLPHRDYWLAPERRAETKNCIFRQGLWFSCLCACFITGIMFLGVYANMRVPVEWSIGEFIALLICFLAGTFIWALISWLHFKRLPKNTDQNRSAST